MPFLKDDSGDGGKPKGIAIIIGDKGAKDVAIGAMAEKRAARDVRKAIEGGDDGALAAALKAFGGACGWDDGQPEPDADDSGDGKGSDY